MSLDVSAYPRCSKFLAINMTNLSDPLMNEYWASVIVADFCHDDALAEFGGFDFSDRSSENGSKLLVRLEDCIRQRKHKAFSLDVPNGLVSLLGARGVRTSVLKTHEDWWKAAETLFPGLSANKRGFIALYEAIVRIPKKERKRLSDANLHRLPAEWISSAGAHQHKLRGAQ